MPWSQPSEFQLPLGNNKNGELIEAVHCEVGKLRRHRVASGIYRHALKRSFFEPSARNAALYNRFMKPLTRLVEEWWETIKDSRKFEQHRTEIQTYHATLRPGDVTLLGLICDGGQRMRTANNGRFLGYLEGTSQAEVILRRQSELLRQWKDSPHIARHLSKLEKEGKDFPEICDKLKLAFDWREELRLRRGELYRIVSKRDVVDVERMTEAEKRLGITHDRKCWVPFRKGDPEGNKWISFDPLYILWSRENVGWLSDPSNPEPRWQGQKFFFTDGITWTLLGNHASLKVRLQPKCVFDASGSRLTPVSGTVSAHFILSMMNSDLVTYLIKRFLKNTAAYEIGDLRQVPIVMPTVQQEKLLASLAEKAIEIQTDILQNGKIERQQELDAIQTTLNKAVEDLYGVSDLGPFNEF